MNTEKIIFLVLVFLKTGLLCLGHGGDVRDLIKEAHMDGADF